ncbi:MAG: GxxExxY protein [Phycisphaerales bacterium JB039]
MHRRQHDNRGDRRGGRHQRRGLPLSELDPALTDISRRVIGCAIEVHKELGSGYTPEIYSRALQLELADEGINFKADHAINVMFGDDKVGEVVASLFVEERFIVDLLARPGDVGAAERLACRAKLRALELELGLIINFCERRLKDGLVRVLNPDQIAALQRDGESGEYEDDDYEDEAPTDEAGGEEQPEP